MRPKVQLVTGKEKQRKKLSRQLPVQSGTNKLTPPDVGAADPNSAMDMPTNKMKILATNQPQTMAAGPPFGIA